VRKVTKKQKEKNEIKKKETLEMFSFFLLIWKERKHKSEVSGKWLGDEALSIFFHHILPKSKYPEARLDKDNIILLTFDEHTKVENDPTFYEEINKRRLKLKEKYD
jgi:hypothetical protein